MAPPAVLKEIKALPNWSTVMLANYHRCLAGLDVIQALQNLISDLKEKQQRLIIIAPSSDKVPEELRRSLVTYDYPLPSRDQLDVALQTAVNASPKLDRDTLDTGALLDAAAGLTLLEAEDAFTLSVVKGRGTGAGARGRKPREMDGERR